MFCGDLPLENVTIINSENSIDKIIEKHSFNKDLLKERNISNDNIIAMDYYTKINYLLNLSKILEEVKDKLLKKQYIKEAKRIGKDIDKCEKHLQKLWNFKLDPSYYYYWIKIPRCLCPIMDNIDNRGIQRIIRCECPYHNFLCKTN